MAQTYKVRDNLFLVICLLFVYWTDRHSSNCNMDCTKTNNCKTLDDMKSVFEGVRTFNHYTYLKVSYDPFLGRTHVLQMLKQSWPISLMESPVFCSYTVFKSFSAMARRCSLSVSTLTTDLATWHRINRDFYRHYFLFQPCISVKRIRNLMNTISAF